MLKSSEILEAKLGFFILLASKGFLMKFHAVRPMAPFLCERNVFDVLV